MNIETVRARTALLDALDALGEEVAHAATTASLTMLTDLFAVGPDAPGAVMAGRAERAIGAPEQVSVAVNLLASDLLSALDH